MLPTASKFGLSYRYQISVKRGNIHTILETYLCRLPSTVRDTRARFPCTKLACLRMVLVSSGQSCMSPVRGGIAKFWVYTYELLLIVEYDNLAHVWILVPDYHTRASTVNRYEPCKNSTQTKLVHIQNSAQNCLGAHPESWSTVESLHSYRSNGHTGVFDDVFSLHDDAPTKTRTCRGVDPWPKQHHASTMLNWKTHPIESAWWVQSAFLTAGSTLEALRTQEDTDMLRRWWGHWPKQHSIARVLKMQTHLFNQHDHITTCWWLGAQRLQGA